MDEQKFSLLSDKGIVRNMELGNVIIEPFVRENLSTSSYDVTLGPNYFRETSPEPGQGIYNPFSESILQLSPDTLHHGFKIGRASCRERV